MTPTPPSSPIQFDLLHTPRLGWWLRWRWGRLLFQLPLLLLVGVMLYDAFTGPRLAATNLATVLTWVHFRGLVMVALLLVGNLFCMSCPFTIPRTLALRWRPPSRRQYHWPRHLRGKWLALGVLLLYFWLYEWWDLWASPLLTGWIIVGYFLAALVLEALFDESPFCKYICPLGTFNYLNATLSPLQITVQQADVCRSCAGKECVQGNGRVLGCGTQLFPPQITSNLDCTFCLDCARACPYDNVALALRSPLAELTQPHAWLRRWDVNLLALVFAFTAVGNAFGMVPPIYALEASLMTALHTDSEGLVLFLILLGLNGLLPVGLGLGAAWLSRRANGRSEPLRLTLARYAPAFLPLAFAIWFVHYAGFHFLSGAQTLVPVGQTFLRDVGLWSGSPNWAIKPLLPLAWLNPLETGVLLAGTAVSLYILGKRARPTRDVPLAQLPWMGLILLLAAAAMIVMSLPMEMRGTPS